MDSFAAATRKRITPPVVELNVCIYGWRVCSSCVDVNPYRADRKLAQSHESGSNIMAQGIVTAAAIII